jgi:hypothetical protein
MANGLGKTLYASCTSWQGDPKFCDQDYGQVWSRKTAFPTPRKTTPSIANILLRQAKHHEECTVVVKVMPCFEEYDAYDMLLSGLLLPHGTQALSMQLQECRTLKQILPVFTQVLKRSACLQQEGLSNITDTPLAKTTRSKSKRIACEGHTSVALATTGKNFSKKGRNEVTPPAHRRSHV